MAEMRASMLLKIAVEGKDQVQGLAREMEALQQAGRDLGKGIDGQTRLSDWGRERQAVEGVVSSVRELAGAVTASSGGIGEAIGRWDAEKGAVQGLIAEVGDLEKAIRRVASERIAPQAGGGGILGGSGRGGPAPDEGEGPGGSFDWGGYKVPPHAGPVAGTRASEWMAQQQLMRETEEQAERTSERLGELENQIGRYAMVSMAFGNLGQFGGTIRKPIETADDEFADFEDKTQDIATRMERNSGRPEEQERLLKVARDANVSWRDVFEGHQEMVSQGGGEELRKMSPEQEVRLNQLASAAHATQKDLYSLQMTFTRGGMSAQDALNTSEMLHVEGKRGPFELRNMAQYMPSIYAMAKASGLTNEQASVEMGALLQAVRRDVGQPGEAATVVRHMLQDLNSPGTIGRIKKELGTDPMAVRREASARGENPLFALLNAMNEKMAALPQDQRGDVQVTPDGRAQLVGADPEKLGSIARNMNLRLGLISAAARRQEMLGYIPTPDEGSRATDEDYAAKQSTVRAQQRRAQIAKEEAEIRTGQSQRGVMGAVAGAQAGAWDFGSYIAQHFPVMTGVIGAGSNLGGATLQALGRVGEATLGAATAVKSLQWIGTKYPGIGSAADMFLKGPYDLAKGFGQGINDGLKQTIAEAAGKAPQAAGVGAAEAAGSLTKIAAELGPLAMLVPWAQQHDVGMPEGMQARLRARADAEDRATLAQRMTSGAPALPAIPNIPVTPSTTEAMNTAAKARAGQAGAPVPTTANQGPQVVNNDNKKYVSAPITVNAPITINATVTNTTPAAIGAAVGGAIKRGIKAGTGSLHDGPETK